ncbi:helix-turn-helix domain-containing protein [Nocardioides zeae]
MFNASRLVTARKRRGLTLTALAAETGISRATISALENARNDDPSDETVVALARRLEVLPSFFVGDDLDEIPIDAVSFRALSKMTARTRDRGLAAGRVALLLNDWIEDRFNLPPADLPTLSRRPPRSLLKSCALDGASESGPSETWFICSRLTVSGSTR